VSTKYTVGDNELPHFITFSIVNWIDAFTRNEYKDIFISSLRHCIAEKGLLLHAWVIMSNHVHLIVSAKQGYFISDIIRDSKKFTSKQIVKAIKDNPSESRKEWMIWMFEREGKRNSNNKDFQFWQQDNHPIQLSNAFMLKQRMDYLHDNPVRAGIVYNAEDYVYSSARDYYLDKKGMLDIEKL
jgi:putative transposase